MGYIFSSCVKCIYLLSLTCLLAGDIATQTRRGIVIIDARGMIIEVSRAPAKEDSRPLP
jgi:hypothetical protein